MVDAQGKMTEKMSVGICDVFCIILNLNIMLDY
jgi:hypothetical protein